MFVNEAEIIKKYSFEFCEYFEQNFTKFVNEALQISLGRDNNYTDGKAFSIQFLQNYLLHKS